MSKSEMSFYKLHNKYLVRTIQAYSMNSITKLWNVVIYDLQSF